MPDDIKLVIAIPTAGTVPMSFAYSLATMVSYTAANGIPSRPESSLELKLDVVESSNWITNREQLVKRALDAGMTHLMFLDDDMMFEPQVLDILLGRRQPIVCTNYLIKTEPASDFVAVDLKGKRLPTHEKSKGIQPILYSGFGVSLFELQVFKDIPQPWFAPDFLPEENSYTTEDLPMYRRARDAGYKVYLDHDASKLVTHLGRKAWNWKEVNHG